MDIHGGHIHTGFITSKFLLETLTINGLHDVAMTLMNKTDFPSFGNWIRQGATTTWEEWDGKYSHNHPMYGGCLTWFPRYLAGVNVTTEGAGYRHFDVRPIPTEGLDSVFYSLRTSQGTVSSRVLSSKGHLRQLEVRVPVGSKATIFLPADSKAIRESGRKLKTGKGIGSITVETDVVKVEVGQGTYSFAME
jgi:alpha-L-rhamnosidase